MDTVHSPRYKQAREDYIARKTSAVLNDTDEKLIHAIYNLKKNYQKTLDDRKCTKYIDFSEINNKVEVKTAKAKTPEKRVCKAIKMNGEPCTAAAKENCEFCGRHLPKVNASK